MFNEKKENCVSNCKSNSCGKGPLSAEQQNQPVENLAIQIKEENKTIQPYRTENPQKLIFKIEGMCCASEVKSIKRAINPLIDGTEANLNFDLINAKLVLESKYDELPSKDKIIDSISKIGLTAILWKDHILQAKNATFWQKYGGITMNILSLAGLIIGLVLHLVEGGAKAAFGGEVGGEEIERPGYPPIATMIIYSVSIVAGSWFIFPKAISALKRLRPDPNLLMTIATLGAIGTNHWFEAASSMYLFSIAGFAEAWNISRARKAIRALMELAPTTALVLDKDGNALEQLVEQVPVDAIISVRPGGKIPMDCVLILGSTSVNQAPITGESMPVLKEIGDLLFAGTINGDGAIQCKVAKLASDSTLASIIRKIEEAQSKRAKSDQFIEKFSHYYIPIIIMASVIVAVVPPLVKGNLSSGSTWYPWIYKALELLVISCPCSLVISTPVSIVAGLTAAARSGILIKGGVYLETVAHVKAFAMDKTGTLTSGEPVVQHIIPLNSYSQKDLLKLATALEVHSDHPLARAIKNKAKTENIIYQPAEGFQIFKGRGGEGYIDGELFWIGSHRFLHEKAGNNESTEIHEKILELEAAGHSIVAVGYGQNICGFISIADSVRPESKNAIQAMKKAGIEKILMLTGDNQGAAKAIAESTGVDEWHAELLPEDKVKQIQELATKYKTVAMVGDGINDAPAMATASLGIAMGAAGSDAAIETADIALMSDNLEKLAWLIKHSRYTLNIIKQNVVFSLTVKAVFAFLIFANYSTLWMAMGADIGATFIVVSNAMRIANNKSDSKKKD